MLLCGTDEIVVKKQLSSPCLSVGEDGRGRRGGGGPVVCCTALHFMTVHSSIEWNTSAVLSRRLCVTDSNSNLVSFNTDAVSTTTVVQSKLKKQVLLFKLSRVDSKLKTKVQNSPRFVFTVK